uniref:Latent transforming growth factor beta binding protein 1 n=1 Tax=Xiphophorus maculatus TaxID=8083 RepID=A0A3B5Q0V8_XIPMA
MDCLFLFICVLIFFPPESALGNQTGRIKVVFTPTICKVTCVGSRCHNSCERGNTTTIISENGHATDTLTAPNFRVVVCHLPCINGGKCSARDKCQCPPNFAGKFCQMPVQNGHQQHQRSSVTYGQAQIVSTHTLPLTYSHGQTPVFNPGIVNIHIKHPPEASVQVHQVSQLDNYSNNGHQQQGSHSGSSSSSSYSYHHSESSQKVQHHGYNMVHPNQHGYKVPHYQPVASKNTLGRCFQETAAGQCGKALPGLTKLDQCCATIGTSWGFHKCQKCPNKPCKYKCSTQNCPPGYKRINTSHCQDVDECQLRVVCPNGGCLNTVGSYMCTCKPGYAPDATLTSCIPNTPAVQEEKGACFRLVSSARQCLHPVSAQLSKQLCCCSVGKAWGPRCDKCPPPGTALFKEICPGGMGYTVLPNPPVNKPVTVFQEPDDLLPPQPLPTPEKPVEAFGTQEEILPGQAAVHCISDNFLQFNWLLGGRRRSSSRAPFKSWNWTQNHSCLLFFCLSFTDIDECENRTMCPSGICYNNPGGYSCGTCPLGFVGQGGHCIGSSQIYIDECHDERVCVRGHCLNTEGSFLCQCGPGFRVSSAGDQCNGLYLSLRLNYADECQEEVSPCVSVGKCVNNMGSYTCTCPEGFRQINDTNVDECVEEAELCSPHGTCLNTEGSYLCVCDSGFTASLHAPSCDDVNECELLSSVCGEAECVNVDGSFLCVCPNGLDYNVMIAKCDSCFSVGFLSAPSVERKDCYYHLSAENLCENVLSSHITLQECCCTLGAGWGDNCEVYPCPVNGTGELFTQMCPSGRGFVPNEDLLYGVTFSNSYKDADECKLFDKEVCKGGYCGNTEGSYECYCTSGHYYDPVQLECTDVNECLDESVCDGGECLNTDGSFNCFCRPPMVLSPKSHRCVVLPQLAEMEQLDYQICWQTVTETETCTRPLRPNRQMTFTECCCRFGEAWGMDCALCPPRHSNDYASMCNIHLAGRRQPYGHDALVAGPTTVHPFPYFDRHSAFEGLRAEECGILNGCENGRCVRVQEGYTCDCFAGFTLDLSRMACVDVNECSELNSRMSLCRNGKCINTVGSYRCECLPGYRVSDKPNYCTRLKMKQLKN